MPTIFDWTGLVEKNWTELSTHFNKASDILTTTNKGDLIETAIDSGAQAISTVYAHHAEIGPGGATDNKGSSIQWSPKSIDFVAGKRVDFRARGFWETAANGEGFLGLAVVDTTGSPPIVAGATDAVGFYKAEDATTLYFKCVRDSADTLEVAVATIEDATYLDLEFTVEMDATVAYQGYVTVKVNGITKVPRITCTGITEEVLALTYENISSAAADKSLLLDLIGVRRQVA